MKRLRRLSAIGFALFCTLAVDLGWHSAASAQYAPYVRYVQRRSYEDASQNRFAAWLALRNGGGPIQESEIAGVKLYDPAGTELIPPAGLPQFLRLDYIFAPFDAGSGDFTSWSTFVETGFFFNLANYAVLEAGSYRFEATPVGGDPLAVEVYFPGQVDLTPVSSSTMSAWWDNGSLWLSWAPPATAEPFDQYRLHLLGADGLEIFIGRVDASAGVTTVRLGPQLVQAITDLAAPSAVTWRVQTRNFVDSMNYTRSYSDPVVIPWQTPPPPPPNDEFAQAKSIGAIPYADEADVSGATTGADDPWDCTVPNGTVWYGLTASDNLLVTARTWGSSFWTTIAVVRGVPGSFETVACGSSEVSFPASAGETYYFMVGAESWTSPGWLVFAVDGRVPLDIDVQVDAVGAFNSRIGSAVVAGTVSCSRPASVNVSGWVRQTVGRFRVIHGEFYETVWCDGSAAWSARVLSDAGSFGGGAALVKVYAYGQDPGTGDSDWAEREAVVKLKGGGMK